MNKSSDDTLFNWRLRIKIHRGQQLFGENLYPICQVRFGSSVRSTSIQDCLSDPVWQEELTILSEFNKQNFEKQIISIEVIDTENKDDNNLIGQAQLHARTIYACSDHAYLNKWIILLDNSNSVVRGCLKVSITITCVGEDDQYVLLVDDPLYDTESSVIRHPGIHVQYAALCVSIFRAQELPRMDDETINKIKSFFVSSSEANQEPKALVDPFVVANYAGHTIQTKVIKSNNDPIFNQELWLPFTLPSICSILTLTVYDWNRIEKAKEIGVYKLNLSSIWDTSEQGFLPTLGPCWINIYGKPIGFVEAMADNTEYISSHNMEDDSGVYHNGRLFISITTISIDEAMTKDLKVVPITNEQTGRALIKYKLCAEIFEATILTNCDKSVYFEISIGKYGNSSEQSTGAILSSITSPRYCLCKNDAKAFIDYGANKQFIQLFCQWENIVYRLEGVNQIKRMAASTSEVVKKLQLSEDKTKALDNNQLIDIENLKNLLSESLFNPAFKDASCNLLDKRLFMLRSRTINNIVQRIDEILVGDESIKTTIKILDRIRISLITASRDPQQSIPDVLIWTLINGVKVSYCRIKIEDILLTKSEEGNGIKCGKIRNVILRHPVECQLNGSDHAIVKLRMWFFASSLNPKLTSLIKENIELNAFVNIYENQILRNRKWISDDIIPWSDKAMKLLLNRDYFTLPDVLTWSSKWEIDTLNTCSSQITDKQNMWEYQSREKSGGPWMDRSNIDSSTISSDYYIDKDRHVDDDGWEYADKRDGIWVPACKFHHLHRRRILVTSIKQAAEESGGWMYSSNRNGPYHSKMWNDDTMRTLSWIRYIKPKDTIKTELLTYTPVLFKIEDKIKGKFNIVTSDSCLVRKDSFLYTVIAHIYQIRFSIKIKSSFTKQFYIRVSCLGNSQSSCLVDRNSEDPVDETIVVPGLHVCEDFEETCLCPSQIVLELYNQSNELVARALPKLTVRKHDGENKHSKFNWIPLIKHDGSNFAELLGKIEMIQIPFEGFQCDGIERNSDNTKYVIPNALKPELQYVQITILSLGLRHGWKERFLTLSNPTLVFELGGTIIKSSSLISVKNCSNFKQPIYIFRKTIPTSPEFSPCINLELIDKRSFGRNVSIGKLSTATVNTLLIRSSVNFASNIDDKLKNITKMKCNRIVEANTSVDWWSKFYFTIGKMSKCTLYANSKYQRLKILNSTLEQQIMKYKYSHICENFQFQMTDKKSERISFKGNYFVDCLESSLVDEDILKKYKVPYVGTYSCIVRIYIIRAFNLPPMDQDGKCDPYVRIIAGDKSVNNRNDKCINTLSPIFGKIFEMKLSIPSESLLVIQVKDWNYLMHDNLIGQTVIDLEDRILARGHATCGVPQFYESCGINKWRDSVTPHQLLIQLCEERNIPVDILLNGINSKIKILNKVLTIDNFEQLRSYQFLDDSTIEQSLCLHVIHLIGAVKEHVESRPLINPVHPRLEQGTLQMWIDIFPSDFKTPIPPCVCIDPRKPKTYYLKVIVWNVRTNLKLLKMLSGEDAPDIFIRGIVDGATESVQCTDIHYRCIDGQGNYNWRFIFEVQVLSCEMSFLKMKREHFWSSEVEELSIAPKLKLQLWDNDKFSCDDFIGEVELVLTELQSPSKFPFKHAHKFQKVFDKALCIFHQTRIKGWWPVYGTGQQTNELVAQIEAEIELVSEEEFKIKPSGKGRQEPNENPRLAEPRRPITSFSFISTPYRTFRYFIWKKYKRRIILATIGTFLSAIAISFLEKIPENSWHFLMFKLKKKFG